MASNSTDAGNGGLHPFADEQQQVSGASVFWALAAIVLNAMLQPSFSGFLFDGAAFEGTVWPHRSSPTICFLDAVAEVWVIVDKCRTQPTIRYEAVQAAQPSAVIMRLAIFFLAVLPQAVKLFSMQGVYAAQAIAAVFLFSSVASMARSTGVENPQQDLKRMLSHFRDSNTKISLFILRASVATLGWAQHGCGLLAVWYAIAPRSQISTTADIENLVCWISSILTTAIGIYMIQHVGITVTGYRPPIPIYPVLVILIYTNNFGVADLLRDPSARRQSLMARVTLAVTLLLNTCLLSYGAVYALELMAKMVLGAGASEEGQLPTTATTESSGTPQASTTAVQEAQPVPEAAEAEPAPEHPPSDSSSKPDRVVGIEAEKSTGDDAPGPKPTVTDGPQQSKNEEDFPLLLMILFWPVIVCLVIMHYAGLWPKDGPESAAERGDAAPAPTVPNQQTPDEPTSVVSKALTIVNIPLRFVVRWALIIAGRFFKGGNSLFGYSFNWIGRKLSEQPRDTMVLAFAVVNFATAMVYYLLIFDGAGTSAPEWTADLGR